MHHHSGPQSLTYGNPFYNLVENFNKTARSYLSRRKGREGVPGDM